MKAVVLLALSLFLLVKVFFARHDSAHHLPGMEQKNQVPFWMSTIITKFPWRGRSRKAGVLRRVAGVWGGTNRDHHQSRGIPKTEEGMRVEAPDPNFTYFDIFDPVQQ